MASLKTDLRALEFDSLRTSEGVTGNLTLYQATATGYTLLATISGGWFAQRERDQIEGMQFLAVRVAETSTNLALITSSIEDKSASVGIMSKRYKLKSLLPPMDDPRLWLFQCDPTGESLS